MKAKHNNIANAEMHQHLTDATNDLMKGFGKSSVLVSLQTQ